VRGVRPRRTACAARCRRRPSRRTRSRRPTMRRSPRTAGSRGSRRSRRRSRPEEVDGHAGTAHLEQRRLGARRNRQQHAECPFRVRFACRPRSLGPIEAPMRAAAGTILRFEATGAENHLPAVRRVRSTPPRRGSARTLASSTTSRPASTSSIDACTASSGSTPRPWCRRPTPGGGVAPQRHDHRDPELGSTTGCESPLLLPS
jgi:hypothetical protein